MAAVVQALKEGGRGMTSLDISANQIKRESTAKLASGIRVCRPLFAEVGRGFDEYLLIVIRSIVSKVEMRICILFYDSLSRYMMPFEGSRHSTLLVSQPGPHLTK